MLLVFQKHYYGIVCTIHFFAGHHPLKSGQPGCHHPAKPGWARNLCTWGHVEKPWMTVVFTTLNWGYRRNAREMEPPKYWKEMVFQNPWTNKNPENGPLCGCTFHKNFKPRTSPGCPITVAKGQGWHDCAAWKSQLPQCQKVHQIHLISSNSTPNHPILMNPPWINPPCSNLMLHTYERLTRANLETKSFHTFWAWIRLSHWSQPRIAYKISRYWPRIMGCHFDHQKISETADWNLHF